ncbi:SVSP family protein [Theileria parva strain Muguga]|uniref:Theileria-specific sub-telomeric protein, SVSP family n=1 Tax=Theileria parva TaxID=5875 RepID=Q4N389_THEPA|nr:SVSP family protein [Theileria parva strain Muguga]EAN31450.1 SVSP family protein [Theileria parva strain Muguga]|eukprot:XP_763733.1 hypothetical protein [Theileria parva strain Muguga]
MEIYFTYTCGIILILIQSVSCADKPEQRDITSDTDEDDNFEVTETTVQFPPEPEESDDVLPSEVDKRVKTSEAIKLYGKNPEGKLVEMASDDYKMIWCGPKVVKYKFRGKLEELICDGITAYKHIPGKNYCKYLTYYKLRNVLIFERQDGFLFIRKDKNTWRVNPRKFPDYVKMCRKDSKGKEVEITDKDYYLNLTYEGSFKYKFMPGVKCIKIMIDKDLIWQRKPSDDYPKGIFINLKREITVYFRNCYLLFQKRKGRYKRFTKLMK